MPQMPFFPCEYAGVDKLLFRLVYAKPEITSMTFSRCAGQKKPGAKCPGNGQEGKNLVVPISQLTSSVLR